MLSPKPYANGFWNMHIHIYISDFSNTNTYPELDAQSLETFCIWVFLEGNCSSVSASRADRPLDVMSNARAPSHCTHPRTMRCDPCNIPSLFCRATISAAVHLLSVCWNNSPHSFREYFLTTELPSHLSLRRTNRPFKKKTSGENSYNNWKCCPRI